MKQKNLERQRRVFVLVSLVIGLCATIVAFVLHDYGGFDDSIDRVIVPMAIVIQALVLLLLWRKKDALRLVETVMYVFFTGNMGAKLFYAFFLYPGNLTDHLHQFSPWLPVNYLLAFVIFPRRTATLITSLFLGASVVMGVVYFMFHANQTNHMLELQVLSQSFFAHSLLIGFLFMYAKLREGYKVTQQSVRRLTNLANSDPLLGTANRRYLQAFLTEQVTRAQQSGEPLSIAIMDIDHFKRVNDLYGHEAGDHVLSTLAELIRDELPESAVFGRWGGEEFLLILPYIPIRDGYYVAEHIRCAIEDAYIDRIGRVTASFGVTEHHPGDTTDTMVQRADEALYLSKRSGRNRVAVGT